jgi:hypothetical protein
MHPHCSYELARYKIRELHRRAEIERLARRTSEIKASRNCG